MPEATVLYAVTAVVVLGLIVWVAVVLKTAREPWARPALPLPPADGSGAPPTTSGGAGGGPSDAGRFGADSTSKATPVALAGAKDPSGTESER